LHICVESLSNNKIAWEHVAGKKQKTNQRLLNQTIHDLYERWDYFLTWCSKRQSYLSCFSGSYIKFTPINRCLLVTYNLTWFHLTLARASFQDLVELFTIFLPSCIMEYGLCTRSKTSPQIFQDWDSSKYYSSCKQ